MKVQSSSLDVITLPNTIDKAFDWLIMNWCFLRSNLGIPVLPVVKVIRAVSTSSTSLGFIKGNCFIWFISLPSNATLIGTFLTDGMINYNNINLLVPS